jgi:hypothetical protein
VKPAFTLLAQLYASRRAFTDQLDDGLARLPMQATCWAPTGGAATLTERRYQDDLHTSTLIDRLRLRQRNKTCAVALRKRPEVAERAATWCLTAWWMATA